MSSYQDLGTGLEGVKAYYGTVPASYLALRDAKALEPLLALTYVVFD